MIGYMPAFPKSQNHTRKTRQTMRGSIPVGTKLDLSEIQGSSSGSLRPHTMNLGAQVPDVSGSEQEQNFGFGSLAGFFSDLFETAEAKFTETVYGPVFFYNYTLNEFSFQSQQLLIIPML